MTEPADHLAATFQKQVVFSRTYSELYASLFSAVAAWLVDDPQGDAALWLKAAANGRQALDVTLLLAAGLHREILLGEADVASLAAFYPTVGGAKKAGYETAGGWHVEPPFDQALHAAVLACRAELQAFIRGHEVQTNETGRGIAWLLPLTMAGWPQVQLLDLGASAGLNLVADQRHYRFFSEEETTPILELGQGQPAQFSVRSSGPVHGLLGINSHAPQIVSRQGCDISPFHLRSEQDEAILASFIWGDQVARLQRLREGIAALREVNKTAIPVSLSAANLPDDLPDLLATKVSSAAVPMICYNTFIRSYLPDKGAALRQHLDEWAHKQDRPLLWIQWEPPSLLQQVEERPPDYGWLAWTLDLWHRGRSCFWHIAWVHPHGQQIVWLPGLADWRRQARHFEW